LSGIILVPTLVVLYVASSTTSSMAVKVGSISNIQPRSIIPSRTYRGLPTTLIIPSINVHASIEYTGVGANNDMISPSHATDVSWYKYGTIPGEIGTAVIAGHYVGPRGEPGIFIDIAKLQKGSLLQVTDSNGVTASFAVSDIKTYNAINNHSEVFNSISGSHLNIITCAGEWDAVNRHYLDRTVVFAELIN
jgi:sortase (surface protein transpeptidase)